MVSAPSAIRLGVVRKQSEFLIDALPGHGFGDDLFALDVAFDPQISPFMNGFAKFGDKRRVAKVGKLLPVGIGFGDEFVLDIKFEVVAVGENNRLGESDGLVATQPSGKRARAQFLPQGRTAIYRNPQQALGSRKMSVTP